MNKLIINLCATLTLMLATAVAFADPTPFRAVYKADYKGLPVSAVGIRELKQVEDNKYLLTSSAKSFFASVTEQSTFSMNEQQPVPLEYRYKRTGIGQNLDINLAFNWLAGTAIDEHNDQAVAIDLTEGTLDKLLYQLKMRDDLQEAVRNHQDWPEMTYQIADRKRTKIYTFKVIGEEQVDTPVGKINAIRAVRVRKNGNRVTTFWMAPEYEFMLVRLLQKEKNGSGFELLLKEAQFNGKAVQGL